MGDPLGRGPLMTGIKQFAQDPENKEPEAVTATSLGLGDRGTHKTLAYTSSKSTKVDGGGGGGESAATPPSTTPPSQQKSSQEPAS